jgi:DNA processing protein
MYNFTTFISPYKSSKLYLIINTLLKFQIALTLIPGVGDINAKKLINHCGGVEAIFKEKKHNILKIQGIGESIANSIHNKEIFEKVDKELLFIEKYNIKPLFYLDKAYPSRLKNCIDSPLLMYYMGNAELNKPKVVSIVGTRKATDYGKEITKKFVDALTSEDVLVVSGLAYGIDTASHRAAVDANIATVGVLAHGLDMLYPALNKPLAEKMLKNGGLLTEFRSNTIPDRENFPKRNRIIAGMADAVIVVEAARKGGALITAEIANTYNKDVFAIPGRLTDIYSEGCNHLIKTNKAVLIESAEDLIFLMSWENPNNAMKNRQQKLFIEFTDDEKIIYDLIFEKTNLAIDEIIGLCNMPASKVASALLSMEFNNIIKCIPGKIYKLT